MEANELMIGDGVVYNGDTEYDNPIQIEGMAIAADPLITMEVLQCPHLASFSGLTFYCLKGKFPVNCEACDCNDKYFVETTTTTSTASVEDKLSYKESKLFNGGIDKAFIKLKKGD